MPKRIGVSSLFRPFDTRSTKEIEAEILEELASHLELATSDNLEEGMEPDSARRAAEVRFGDFGHAFGACRTEKLKERLMLQKVLFVLVMILSGTVVLQAYQLQEGQRETERAIGDMRTEVMLMTRRIEDRFDAALLIGELGTPRRAEGTAPRPWTSPSDDLLESTNAGNARRIDDIRRDLDELRRQQSQMKPSHSRYSSLLKTIAQNERELQRLDPGSIVTPLPSEALRELSAELRIGAAGAFERAVGAGAPAVPALSEVLRDEQTDPAVRFEAVHALGEISQAWEGHSERALATGDVVSIGDAYHDTLSFTAEVDPQGNLAVPSLGFVRATGLTRGELEALLQRELERYYASVDIQVSKEAWAFDALLDALRDPDVFVRVGAAQVLGRIGDPRARRALAFAAENDPEQAVRESATKAHERVR